MAKSNYNSNAQERNIERKNYGGINLFNSGYKTYINIIRNKLNTYYKNKLGKEQNKCVTYIMKTSVLKTPT